MGTIAPDFAKNACDGRCGRNRPSRAAVIGELMRNHLDRVG
jgi:hypothetical protein